MKRARLILGTFVWLGITLASTGASAAELQWSDLVGHPEYWSPASKLTVPLELRDGTKLAAGTDLRIQSVSRDNVGAFSVPDCVQVSVSPAQCDLLESSAKYLASLSPAQRAVKVESLWADLTITPGVVTLMVNYKVPPGGSGSPGGNTLPAGTKVTITKFDSYAVRFNNPSDNQEVMIGYALTDILQRARTLANAPKARRAGRITEMLIGRTVDADGSPTPPKLAEFFVLAYSSAADPRSQQFASKLAEQYKANLADRKNIAVVMVSLDKTPEDALKFAKDNGVVWPIVPPNRTPLQFTHFNPSKSPTAIVITDRFGNIGYSNLSGRYANEPQESIVDRFVTSLKKAGATPAPPGK